MSSQTRNLGTPIVFVEGRKWKIPRRRSPGTLVAGLRNDGLRRSHINFPRKMVEAKEITRDVKRGDGSRKEVTRGKPTPSLPSLATIPE